MKRYLLAAWAFLCSMLLFLGQETAEAAPLSEITSVRTNAQEDSLRIVVDMSSEASFKTMMLSSPSRLVIDITNACLASDLVREHLLDRTLASKIRLGQFNETTVRIVIETDIKKDAYNIFYLDEGSPRIVIDLEKSSAKTEEPPVEQPAYEPIPEPEPDPQEEPKEEPKEGPQPEPYSEILSGPLEEAAGKPQRPSYDTDSKDYGGSIDDQIAHITDLSGRTITIDPGHGGNDAGAIGPSGLMEKTVTLNVAKELKKILEADGATVYMTRTMDTEVSPRKARASDIEELQARCDFANRRQTDIFISIHMDSFTNRTAHGTTGYYAEGSQKSRRLADCIRQNVMDQLGTESRGTQSCKFYVVQHTDMPATLVELAFISNVAEERLMGSDDGIQKAAQGIADGIADYFG